MGKVGPKRITLDGRGTSNSRPSYRGLSNGSGCFLLPIRPTGTRVCNAWNPPPPNTLPGRHSIDMEKISPPCRSRRGHKSVHVKNRPSLSNITAQNSSVTRLRAISTSAAIKYPRCSTGEGKQCCQRGPPQPGYNFDDGNTRSQRRSLQPRRKVGLGVTRFKYHPP